MSFFSQVFSLCLYGKKKKFYLELDSFSVYPGFAFRWNLCICFPAAHPLGGAWGEDDFGEGRQRAGGGTGRPAFQYALPGGR